MGAPSAPNHSKKDLVGESSSDDEEGMDSGLHVSSLGTSVHQPQQLAPKTGARMQAASRGTPDSGGKVQTFSLGLSDDEAAVASVSSLMSPAGQPPGGNQPARLGIG